MPNTTTQKSSLFEALSALTTTVSSEKQAAVKAAAPVPADPGGYQGATTHPTKDEDNGGSTTSEGARSSENHKDVSADQGTPAVDNSSELKPGDAEDKNLNVGVSQSSTGEDPSVEDDYKAGKDDPGSSHPARTDNDDLDGRKYANASVSQLSDVCGNLANTILADIANGYGTQLEKSASNKPADNSPKEAPAAEGSDIATLIKQAAETAKTSNAPKNADLAAGYELAKDLGMAKEAAQQYVAESVAATISDAEYDASLTGDFLTAFRKTAMDEVDSAEDHDAPDDADSGAAAPDDGGEGAGPAGPAAAGPPDGGEGGGASLGDLLGGGGAPAPAPEQGMPMDDGMGGVGQEEALMQLVAALEELGIPLEALAGAGGPPPGGDPMGGGAPPMEAGGPPPGGDPMAAGGPPPGGDPMAAAGGPPPGGDPMGEGMKLASAATKFKKSGRYQFTPAYQGSRERMLRDQMKVYVTEVLGASA